MKTTKRATRKRKKAPSKDKPAGGPVKLNLGAGEAPVGGYVNLDRKGGQEVYPLAYPDNSVDEIRASHILEHFGHGQTMAVLGDWVRTLKPGGLMKIGVPDFDFIATHYIKGTPGLPLEGYIMGGQVDGNDVHGAIFNHRKLREALWGAGLIDVQSWQSEARDCASLPVSLNLQGTKPTVPAESFRVAAVMSMPRLGFSDNFFCAFQALLPLKINIRKYTGAYWGQCLERVMEMSLDDEATAILTLDYDTVFCREDVERLVWLLGTHPEVDAIACVQVNRSRPFPLMTIRKPDGSGNVTKIDRAVFDPDLLKVSTAHFGLTLLRASALQKMPHPWFIPEPDENGKWDEGRLDDDINFWRKWGDAGNTLYLANRLVIGHAELMFKWPDGDFETIYQHPSEYAENGAPLNVWK